MEKMKKPKNSCPLCGEIITHIWYDNKSPTCICGFVSEPGRTGIIIGGK